MSVPQCLTLRATADPATARLRAALERIASTSPRAWHRPGCAEDERCLHCRALIDEARDALGWARWPAGTGSPA